MTVHLRPTDAPLAVWFAWLAVIWSTLELFLVFDWNHGIARFALVAVLAAWLVLYRRSVRRFTWTDPPSAAWTRGAVILLVIGVLMNVGPAGFFLVRTLGTRTVRSDQAQTVLDALHVLGGGVNPYGARTVTDRVAYRLALKALEGRPTCRASAGPVFFRVGLATDEVVPGIAPTDDCTEIRRQFSSLGFKYGPAMLLFYAPFLWLLGPAGFITSHLLLVAACSGLLFRRARDYSGSVFWGAAALLPLLWPTHLAWNVLALEHLDLLPVILVVLAVWFWERDRFAAAGACLGVSLAAKFLPALLFLPLLLKAPRRYWAMPVAVACVFFLPFAVWDWNGLRQNLGYPFMRPPDSTAIAFFLSPGASGLLRASALGLILALAAGAHLRGWSTRTSLEYLVAAHLLVLASGTTLHNNYLVWLLPVLSLFLLDEAGVTAATPAR